MKKIIMLCAAVGIAASVTMVPALADSRNCKSSTVSRTGGDAKLLLVARKRARDAWRQKVDENYGKEWSAWYVSRDLGYHCHKKENGRHICTAKAKPCEIPVVIKGPGKQCAFYRYEGTGAASKLKFVAEHNARKKWSEQAKFYIGSRFDTWLISADRKNECKKNKDGKFVCVAGAKPCRIKLIR